MPLLRSFASTLLLLTGSFSAFAQEIPKTSNGLAAVHQFGIVRAGTLQQAEPLPIPAFVHQSDTPVTDTALLDYSALYFLPPLMMKTHLEFTVTARLEGGTVTAWYPYAHETTVTSTRVWRNLQAGVMADGLETDHRQWMMPRAMELASTVKVYKPGPPASKPDDIGTTEGDVYLFLRGTTNADFLQTSREGEELVARVANSQSAALMEANPHAWLAEATSSGTISRAVMLKQGSAEALRTSSRIDDGSAEVQRTEQDLLTGLNEAITGYGLRPDEAMAQARLIMESLRLSQRPVLIYFLNREWIDARFPLEIEGPAERPVRVFVVMKGL